jgi:maltooligosyltrehalose trehalohydrolase
MNAPRGTDPSRVPMSASVVCLQNHDQVGNRAVGDRLHHTVDLAAWRAASVVLLTSPMTPLLFMGQEWAATSPFLYFTDLEPELGRAVTEGRRREFKDFPSFGGCHEVPDPQAESTFLRSKLPWSEREREPHSTTLALYQRLLALRAEHPALQASRCPSGEAWAHGDGAIVMRRRGAGETFVVVAALREPCDVPYAEYADERGPVEPVLSTEDPSFAADPMPPEVAQGRVAFRRPGAVLLRTAGGSAGTPRT